MRRYAGLLYHAGRLGTVCLLLLAADLLSDLCLFPTSLISALSGGEFLRGPFCRLVGRHRRRKVCCLLLFAAEVFRFRESS